MIKTTLTLSGILFSISACTWVNENPDSQSVAITSLSELSQCKQVGTISASTKHKVAFVKRGSKKVTSELQALARNEAIKLGANTIAPKGDMIDGKQSYAAFSCPR